MNWIKNLPEQLNIRIWLVSIVVGSFLILLLWKVPQCQVSEYRKRLQSFDSYKSKLSESFEEKAEPKDHLNLEKDLLNAEKDAMSAEKDLLNAETSARTTLAQIIGGLVLLSGLYFTWLNIKATEEGKLTDRFSKAVELLGNKELDIRLGGIYALERISRDSEKDHWTVMEILTAYVREHTNLKDTSTPDSRRAEIQSPYNPEALQELPTDIRTVLTIFSRRKWQENEKKFLYLTREHFHQITASYLNLSGLNLQRTDLRWANLSKVYLRGTNFSGADLSGADLRWTDLSKASFIGTNFSRADLRWAMALTWEQLAEAYIDESTKLPPDLKTKWLEQRKAETQKQQSPNQSEDNQISPDQETQKLIPPEDKQDTEPSS